MDETEVMRQKIQELEAEVRELKTMLPKKSRRVDQCAQRKSPKNMVDL